MDTLCSVMYSAPFVAPDSDDPLFLVVCKARLDSLSRMVALSEIKIPSYARDMGNVLTTQRAVVCCCVHHRSVLALVMVEDQVAGCAFCF